LGFTRKGTPPFSRHPGSTGFGHISDLCSCEHCPDGYCTYAAQIHALLRAPSPASVVQFIEQGSAFLHAHSPLASLLIALLLFFGLQPVPAFSLLNVAATLLCWRSLRRQVERTWKVGTLVLLQLLLAFASNAIVLRSLARPVTDIVGTLCVLWALAAIVNHVTLRNRSSATRLVILQVVGLASRVSFIPMLGMPALAELLEDGSLRDRLRRAVVAGTVFGAAPALLFFGTLHVFGFEHLQSAWQIAHRPDFVSQTPLRDLTMGVLLSGGLFGMLAILRWEGTRTRAQRVHIAWIALYLAFLVSGRGALWPRYFLPIVPSLLIAATPALVALDARRSAVGWAALAFGVLLTGHALVSSIKKPLDSVAMLATSLVSPQDVDLPGQRLAARGRAKLAMTTSVQGETSSITVDLGRPRRVAALQFTTDPEALSAGIAVLGSLDERSWTPLPFTLLAEGLFAERPRFVLRVRAPRVRSLRLTVPVSRGERWTVDDLDVRVVRQRARSRGREKGLSTEAEATGER